MFNSTLRKCALLSVVLGLTLSQPAFSLTMQEDVIHFGDHAKTAPTADQVKADQVITDRVVAAVKADKDLFAAISNFSAKSMGGIVTVTGNVKSADMKVKLMDKVKAVDGVFGVVDQVTVNK